MQPIAYDPTAAHKLLDDKLLQDCRQRVEAARTQVLDDVDLIASGNSIPVEKQPLDAGFIDLPQRLLDERSAQGDASLLGQIESAAAGLRNELDCVVSLGIGGSYMGGRALFEALCSPYHNELAREQRQRIPRLYFEGHNLDSDTLSSLTQLIESRYRDSSRTEQRWGIVVISKSGGTLETAVAFRLLRQKLEEYYGADSGECRRYVVPITGETGRLRELAVNCGYENVFPIPDHVGGRFSVFTAVGLVPAALLDLNLEQLLQGALDMTERFRNEPFGNNPVLDYTATCHLFEREQGMTTRVLSTWGARLEALGFWYDQLLSESLGKQEHGATPITVVNTRDLHSRGQQHQEGRRDRLITNVIVESPTQEPPSVPTYPDDADRLNALAGKAIPELLSAAIAGTNRAYADAGRPTADIRLPRLNEYVMGQLLQMLMLATAVEGRLIGINPYGQPGVEAYKRNMQQILQSD